MCSTDLRGGGPAGPVAGEVGGPDLGAEAGEVELLLVAQQAPLLLPRQLLVHPLVLPLGQPPRERPRTSPHRSHSCFSPGKYMVPVQKFSRLY